MILDISFEYDCSHEEYKCEGVLKAEKGGRLVCAHTEAGQKFLESHGILAKLNERMWVDYDKNRELYRDYNSLKALSASIGNFYWKNKEHTEHI